MTKAVKVELPGTLVWELWRIAEARRVSVAEVITTALQQRPAPKHVSQAEATREKVRALVRAGLDDGAIAVELDRTRGYVSDVRRRYGMKPNKRAGAQKEEQHGR